tara:strand:+ start:2915 stop:3388 length:474 start_codon:yes stop_codon:yes gene_type:complete
MAVLIFNLRRNPFLAAKEENDLLIHRGDLDAIKADGRFKTISDEDYKSWICREKIARLDGDNVVWDDPENPNPDSISSEDFDGTKQMYIDLIEKMQGKKGGVLNKPEFADLKSRIDGLKAGLQNVDKSGISFPITTTFPRYWIDNESSEMFDIQFIS